MPDFTPGLTHDETVAKVSNYLLEAAPEIGPDTRFVRPYNRSSFHRVARFAIKFAFGKATFRAKVAFEKVVFVSKVAFGKVDFASKVAFGKVIPWGWGLELGDEVVQVVASVLGDVALGVKLYAPERQVAMP